MGIVSVQAAVSPVVNTLGSQDGDGPPMVAVTMHVHGKRPVSELASTLTELDLVDAVVATNPQPADERPAR
jgi:hypothetical protein